VEILAAAGQDHDARPVRHADAAAEDQQYAEDAGLRGGFHEFSLVLVRRLSSTAAAQRAASRRGNPSRTDSKRANPRSSTSSSRPPTAAPQARAAARHTPSAAAAPRPAPDSTAGSSTGNSTDRGRPARRN